uniref:Uncharacterized protein n=1 Tax=Rhizophora mucronata TaxID=61149 RepID=A0A2P2PUN0_RHIMU
MEWCPLSHVDTSIELFLAELVCDTCLFQ